MNSTRLYPGMCDDSLEIFFHPEERTLKAIVSGTVKNFADIRPEKKQFLNNILESEPDLQRILETMFPGNKTDQIEKLAECRFGGLNFHPDYCGKTNTHNYDIIDCKIRSSCAGNGVVCKNLKYNGEELSSTDVLAIKLMASDYKTEVLAQELNMPLGSFHVYRTNFFQKVGVKSKPELARVGVELGLI